MRDEAHADCRRSGGEYYNYNFLANRGICWGGVFFKITTAVVLLLYYKINLLYIKKSTVEDGRGIYCPSINVSPVAD